MRPTLRTNRIAAALSFALAACGSAPAAAPDAAPASLHLDLHGGIVVADLPVAGGHPFNAVIDVTAVVDGKVTKPADATLTLNGVALARTPSGSFNTEHADGLHLAPGAAIELVATGAGDRVQFTMTCPDVALTAPAEGASVISDELLSVAWTGTIAVYPPPASIDTPSLLLSDYDSSKAVAGSSGAHRSLTAGAHDATIVVPPHGTSSAGFVYDAYLLQLYVPGAPADTGAHEAIEPYCIVVRQVRLKG